MSRLPLVLGLLVGACGTSTPADGGPALDASADASESDANPTDTPDPDGGICTLIVPQWDESIAAILPSRECSIDSDCRTVSISLECRQGLTLYAAFHRCDVAVNQAGVAAFNAERDRLSAELCDSLTEPACYDGGCSVDAGTPWTRCVAGVCVVPE